MGSLLKSKPEEVAEALQRAKRRGRANLTEAALILGHSQPTIRAMVNRQEIRTFQLGRLHWVAMDEMTRLYGRPL